MWYYSLNQFDINIVHNPRIVMVLIFLLPAILGLVVLRYAPRGGVPPRLSVAVSLGGIYVLFARL